MLSFKELEDASIVQSGHFKLRTGKHSNRYINKDLILTHPDLFSSIIDGFRHRYYYKVGNSFTVKQIENLVFTGPAVAGAIFGAALAYSLRTPFVYPEKVKISDEEGKMQFRRGFDTYLKDKIVIVIEDIVTTGASILKTIDAVDICGGTVIYTLSLLDRGSLLSKVINYDSLIYQNLPAWNPDECPLCAEGIEMTPTPKGDK